MDELRQSPDAAKTTKQMMAAGLCPHCGELNEAAAHQTDCPRYSLLANSRYEVGAIPQHKFNLLWATFRNEILTADLPAGKMLDAEKCIAFCSGVSNCIDEALHEGAMRPDEVADFDERLAEGRRNAAERQAEREARAKTK